MSSLSRIDRLAGYGTDRPRTVAVASGKGGVGKSVIAFNLAERAARQARVLLIDADFTMGNQHLLANVSPACGWQTVCSGENDLSDAVVPVADGFDLLASAVGRPEQMLPDTQDLARFLGEIEKTDTYDVIVFDTASGVLPHTNLILNAVDEVILVTTPELTAISDSYALYKILVTNSGQTAVSLLVNRGDRPEDIEYIHQKFTTITSQFLGRSPNYLGSLLDDPVVVESVARQAALAEFAPESEIFRQFADLAENLIGRSAAERTPEPTNLNPAGADIRE